MTQEDNDTYEVWGERVDGDEVKEQRRFMNDFTRALDMGGRRLITGNNADGGSSLEKVQAVCYQYHRVVNTIFSYYCACGTDLSQMYLNDWSQFLEDFELVDNKSQFCKKSDMDRLFIQVDSKAALNMQEKQTQLKGLSTKERELTLKRERERDQAILDGKATDLENSKGLVRAVQADLTRNAFSRVEFFVALLNIAVSRYILVGHASNLQEAMLYLLVGDLESVLNGEGALKAKVFVDPAPFREEFCYKYPVTLVFLQRLTALRRVFHIICRASDSASLKMLSVDDWMNFLRGINLFTGELTEREGTLCFSWSRSVCEDETTKRGYINDTCLPFEGFLEALARLAVLTTMPTDDELAAAGYVSEVDSDHPDAPPPSMAGPYLVDLKLSHEVKYKELCSREHSEWGDDPKRQPMERRIAHLLSIIFHALARQRQNATGYGLMLSKDCASSAPEVLEWMDTLL